MQSANSSSVVDSTNSVVCGAARFSALSQGLVRLEWSATGQFEDRPTAQAITRPSAMPFKKQVMGSDGVMHLETEYIHIAYRPGPEPFNDDNLRVHWQQGQQTGVWTPSTVDMQNLGGTFTSLDLIHRKFHPQGVHPASVEATYPYTQQWLYPPMKMIHRMLRDRGETTHFEDPPLWYLDRYRPDDLPPEAQQWVQEWHRFPPGLLSQSGYSVLNDSTSAAIADGQLVERPAPQTQDWYFFAYGSDYAQALQDFVRLCGPIPMLPRWAFGVWFSIFNQLHDQDYRQLVQQFNDLDLPLDVLVLDVDWHLSGWCGWDWNRELFPDPVAFLQWLHQTGLHAGANVHIEGLPPTDSQFQALCQARGLDPAEVKAGKIFPIKNPTVDWMFEPWQPDSAGGYKPTPEELEIGWLLFNLANPDEARLFMQGLHSPRERDGIDFWWIDGLSATHPGVNSQLWTNHVYYTHLEAQTQRRGMILSRTGGIGSHRYPVQFSADTYSQWEVLEFLVEFTLRAGNVGVTHWSHDLGGFYNHVLGVPSIDPELYVRWVQFGCWSSIVRLHSDHGQREPWNYGRWVLEAVRKTFHTRMQLVPYLYHLNREAYETGLPLCRPLYLAYPQDPEAYRTFTQYLLGDRLLVAPVVESGGYRAVYLPAGDWWERDSQTRHSGPKQLDLYVRLHQVPVFAKAGAILPLQPVTLRVGSTPPDTLILEVYAGASGELDLYEDDGESIAYQTGTGSRRLIQQTLNNGQYILHCHPTRGSYPNMPATRNFQIHWIGLPKDSQITSHGTNIQASHWVGDRLELHLQSVPATADWQITLDTNEIT